MLLKNVIYALLAVAVAACTPASTANNETTAQTDTTTTSSSATATEATVPSATTSSAAAEENRPMSQYQNKVAEVHTSAGEIDIRFFPDVAPNHVKNFIDLAEKGFYNGTKFHRVIPGFMIQGGDPNTISGSPATWGTGGSGKNIDAEFNSVKHVRGIVAVLHHGGHRPVARQPVQRLRAGYEGDGRGRQDRQRASRCVRPAEQPDHDRQDRDPRRQTGRAGTHSEIAPGSCNCGN